MTFSPAEAKVGCVQSRWSFAIRLDGSPWTIRREAGNAVIPLTPRLLCDDMIALKQAAITGLGIVALPGYACRDDVRSGVLRRALPA